MKFDRLQEHQLAQWRQMSTEWNQKSTSKQNGWGDRASARRVGSSSMRWTFAWRPFKVPAASGWPQPSRHAVPLAEDAATAAKPGFSCRSKRDINKIRDEVNSLTACARGVDHMQAISKQEHQCFVHLLVEVVRKAHSSDTSIC